MTLIREELINEQDDFNKLEPEGRIEAAQKARNLYRALKDGIEANRREKMDVLRALRMQFGPRIPLEQERIADDTPQSVVRAAPAVIVPQPEVRRTKSG